MNIKLIVVATSVVVLTACSPRAEQLSYPVLPEELKDCKFYSLTGENGSYMKVMRCPNSTTSTTYPVGKSSATAVVIDGVEYIKKER